MKLGINQLVDVEGEVRVARCSHTFLRRLHTDQYSTVLDLSCPCIDTVCCPVWCSSVLSDPSSALLHFQLSHVAPRVAF